MCIGSASVSFLFIRFLFPNGVLETIGQTETEMAELKVNSLRVRFESGSAEPADADIFAFMRDKMKLRPDELLSMYKDKMTMSVIIKFRTEEDMLKALGRLPGTMDFVIDKYRSCKVTLSAANSVVRYVRLFNLPPEIEDKEIWAVMSKYGNIQRMVRETYGAETGYPIWTSVRGLYVELKEGEEIPASVSIRNIRARVYYEGLVNKCYQCGSTEHIKVDCPKRRSVNERLRTDQTESYSGALKAVWSKTRNAAGPNQKDNGVDGKMTNLNALFGASTSSSSAKSRTSNDEAGQGDTPAKRSEGVNQRMKPNETRHNDTTVAETAEPVTHTMEADGVSHTEEAHGLCVSHTDTTTTDDGAHQHMETEGSPLKRARDNDRCKESVETDDSSLSDTSTVEKGKDAESTTVSGWQKVSTRARSKQLKLSQKERRSKSVASQREGK